jgi:hypothetical protein
LLVILPYLKLLAPAVELLNLTERPLILVLRGFLVVPQVLWQIQKVLARARILEDFLDLCKDTPQLSDLKCILQLLLVILSPQLLKCLLVLSASLLIALFFPAWEGRFGVKGALRRIMCGILLQGNRFLLFENGKGELGDDDVRFEFGLLRQNFNFWFWWELGSDRTLLTGFTN